MKGKNIGKRALSLILAFLMVFGGIPFDVFDFSEDVLAATGELASRETIYFPSSPDALENFTDIFTVTYSTTDNNAQLYDQYITLSSKLADSW